MKYTPVIGLEIHAELKTNSKMFCGCKNDPFGADKPNTYTCPVCLGLPGALPVANKKAIEWSIQLGLALGCKINYFSKFDRKHYFYPDLPKSYQISQYDLPFCYGGELNTTDGMIGITRIHLEEDTGKLLHKTVDGKKVSLIDFNRSSVPLIEIVSEPDIKSGKQAKEFGKKLRQIMRYLDIANCDMEQGGMRLEANISLKKPGSPAGELPNYKVEVKNINSFRFLEQAINYEIKRQAKVLDLDKTPTQETRGWNSTKNETFSQRTKESAEDYRYFPDPDLPPIRFSNEEVEKLRNQLPELPNQKLDRWIKEFSLEERFATMLLNSSKQAIWLDNVFDIAKKEEININKLAKAIINKKIAVKTGDKPKDILAAFTKLHQTDDVSDDELTKIVAEVAKENPDAVAKIKDGQMQVIGFFIGQVMKKAGKKLDAKTVSKMIRKSLG